MRIRHCYIILCVLGTIIPYSQLLPFVQAHGLNLHLLLEQLFANRIGAFFGLDVIVSSVVLWVAVLADRTRGRISNAWLPLLGNLVVGVSLALPLWLYLREAGPDK